MASVLPTSTELFIGQFSSKDAPSPKLAAPINATATTITVTTPLKDSTGTIVTGAFELGIKKANGWTETVWVPAGGVSADGLTYTGCVRGIKPSGYDYTTGDSAYADSHDADELVFCVIPANIPELIRSVLQGLIASGGSDFILGIDADGTVTISRSTGVGTKAGFLRYNHTSGQAGYSNDGTTWVAFDDSIASVVFKVSSADTTAGYAEDKIQAGSNITITKKNTGANEYLEVATTLPSSVSEHATYAPASLTGGGSAESNPALWDSISDGSFRITIDGTAYNVDGIDFTPAVGGDMDDMAAIIQTAIRAATGSTETCVWDTDHFVITSVDTTSSSEVSVTETSTGTVGTDISGAGASDWMDCDSGNGTANTATLDETADAGDLVELEASGNINAVFAGNAVIMKAGEALNGTATPVAVYVSDGSNSRTAGRVYKADADDFTNMAVRFFGFITSSVSTGDDVVVYTSGIVGGFTGLTQGVDYYLSTTAGGISATVTSNPATRVGRAVSATEVLIAKDSPTVQAYASTATGGVLENEYIDVVFTIGFRAKSLTALFQMTGTDKSLSWGQWNNGTQHHTWDVDDSGACQRGSGSFIGQLYHNYSGADYWQIDVQSFTDNTITLRFTAKGAGLTNTILTNLLIQG